MLFAEQLDDEGNEIIVIVEAHCSCEAGNSQSCNHIVGLAYYVQDFIFKGCKNVKNDESPTAQPMRWNIPRGHKILPEKVCASSFCDPLNVSRKRPPVQSTLKNPLMNSFQSSVEEMLLLKKQIAEVNSNIGAAYLLSESLEGRLALPPPMADQSVPSNSFLGNILRTNESSTTSMINLSSMFECKLPVMENNEATNILSSLEPFAQFQTMTLEQCYAIERATKDQASSNIWINERKNRFTASRFGEICKRVLINDYFKKHLLTPTNISHLPHVKFGIENEEVAIQKYLGLKNYKYYKSGLIINPNAPFLGASPDGILYDEEEGYGILEVKCPSSTKYSNIKEALKIKKNCLKCDENSPLLKEKHNYFYQVQGQMLIAGITWADFVVYLKQSDEIVINRLKFDSRFCTEMYKELRETYKTIYFP